MTVEHCEHDYRAAEIADVPPMVDHQGNPVWCEQCGEAWAGRKLTDGVFCAECAVDNLTEDDA